MENTITIKEKSVQEFLHRNLIQSHKYDHHGNRVNLMDHRDTQMMMMDELHIYKDNFSNIKVDDTVIFLLDDIARMSDTKLIDTFTYTCESYDSFSLILKKQTRETQISEQD
jgi:hypothetical protein